MSVGLVQPTVLQDHQTPDRHRWERRRGAALGHNQVA
jgi:hypothetical protein